MDINKAFFVVFSQTSDKECSKDQNQALQKIAKWLEPKKQDSILITSPINECLHSSKFFYQTLGICFYIFEDFAGTKDLKFFENRESFRDNHFDFADVDKSNIRSLIRHFHQKGLIPVFVVDKSVYDNFGLELKGRSDKGLAFYEFNDSAEKRLLKNSVILAETETCSFRNMLRCKFHEKLTGFSFRILKAVQKSLEKTESIERSTSELKTLLKTPKSQEKEYKSQLLALNSALNRSEQVLESLDETINKFISLSNQSFDSSRFLGKIIIKKFVFDLQNSSWLLKIRNKSDENAKNVKIFCIETNVQLFSFKFIQGESTVSSQVRLPNERFYGKNLVAFIENERVSEVFRVYPFEVSCIGSYDEGLEIRVKNNSTLDGANLELAVSNNRTPVKIAQDLKYNQSADEKVKIEPGTKDIVFFVVSLGRQVSQDVLVNLKDDN